MEDLVVNGRIILQRTDVAQLWGTWRAVMNSVMNVNILSPTNALLFYI